MAAALFQNAAALKHFSVRCNTPIKKNMSFIQREIAFLKSQG